MTPDVFAVTFEGGVRAAIQIECPKCSDGTTWLASPGTRTWRQRLTPMPCLHCDGAGLVSALSTVTLPEGLPTGMLRVRVRGGDTGVFYPVTLGLVLPDEFDEGAAARIYDDTGWEMQPRTGPSGPYVLMWRAGEVRTLPVGRSVATARVTEVHPYTDLGADHDEAYCCEDVAGTAQHDYGLWHWRLSGVAVVDDPSPVTAPDGKTVWTP